MYERGEPDIPEAPPRSSSKLDMCLYLTPPPKKLTLWNK